MKPAAFFLPGWGLGRGPLEALVADPAAFADWTILDLPGADGKAAPPSSFPEAAKAIARQLPAGQAVHLGGWSLGAMLALAVAASCPERVKSLLLVGATPSFIAREGWPWGLPAEELRTFAEAIHADAQAMFPRFIGNFCRGDAGNAGRKLARSLIEKATPMPQASLDAGLSWLAEADLRTALEVAPPACPTVVAHGECDPLMPLPAAQWLADRLPHARLLVFPGKAHAPFAPDHGDFWQKAQAAFAGLEQHA